VLPAAPLWHATACWRSRRLRPEAKQVGNSIRPGRALRYRHVPWYRCEFGENSDCQVAGHEDKDDRRHPEATAASRQFSMSDVTRQPKATSASYSPIRRF